MWSRFASLNFGFIRFPVIISSSICLKVELDRVINEVSQQQFLILEPQNEDQGLLQNFVMTYH